MSITMTARNADLQDLAAILKDQHARKVDIVAPAASIRSVEGVLRISDVEPVLDEDGVTMADGMYRPTAVCDEGIAGKLGVPVPYIRRMREERPDLYDANVNGWLHGNPDLVSEDDHMVHGHRFVGPDPRSFLVRCFRGDDGTGVARAFLSDRFKMIDNLDILTSALQGISDAGVEVSIDGCDLSERRMYVRIIAPQVQVMAEQLLAGYRNPFAGEELERWRKIADREGLGYGGEEPIVFAGFVLQNSEVGGGAFSLTPRAVFKVCKNGLVITADAMREVHLGGKLEQGAIDWSSETQEKAAELVRAKTTDAVRTFLSEEYLTRTVEVITEKAERPVEKVEEVRVLTKGLSFTNEQIDGVMERFVRGGIMTRGGVMNAITAQAQMVDDADLAHEMESQAVKVLA